jgi:2-octaprenyl-6-methoxyphenol hydroxylase
VAPIDYDIAIGGAGPVGLALATLLAARGMATSRIALIDARELDRAAMDPRSLALSWGSRQILEDIVAWPKEVHPIQQIHVSRRGHFGRTLIENRDVGVPALGYVSRYGAVVTALAAAAERAGVRTMRPVQIAGAEELADRVVLTLGDGRTLHAGLLVQAEGGLYSDRQGKPISRDYNQTAVICHVTVSEPQPLRAFERFTDEGPLALLPQDDGYALVWCLRPARAQLTAALPEASFLAQLQAAFGQRLGRFLSASPRLTYPLGLNAGTRSGARTVAIGNAAQTLHPVAGQGLNLGLRDAAVLARMLASAPEPDTLRRFEAARRPDRGLTIGLTDTMARLFADTPAGVGQSLLGLSLGLLDAVAPARRLLAEQMMFGRRAP